jgi:DNA repair exonuclease SbcCD ATPase subunit
LLSRKCDLMQELKTCLRHINERFDGDEGISPASVLALLQQCSDLIGSDYCPTEVDAPERSVDDEVNSTESNNTMLNELQQRIVDLEDAFQQEKGDWDIERTNLERKLNLCELEKESRSLESSRNVEAMRLRYDQSLKDAQEALKEQMTAARIEIDRLQERLSSEHCGEHIAHAVDETAVADLRRLLEESKASFDKYREKMLLREEQHSEELRNVWTHFDRYRMSQEHIVASMQNEISILEKLPNSPLDDDAQQFNDTVWKSHDGKMLEYKRWALLHCRPWF